ncbi:hypothetical protein VKS41_006970 [Umbelopsis sp. WA50703]
MVNIVTYAVGMLATLAAVATAQAPSASAPEAASSSAAAAAPATSSSSSSAKYNLQNAGGKVLSGDVNVYLIFYGDWTSQQAQTDQITFMNFVGNISDSTWFKTLSEYNDNSGGSVTGPVKLAAAVSDSGSQQLNLTDTTVHQTIITEAVKSGYLSTTNAIDPNGIYVILAGQNVADAGFCTQHCGYNYHADNYQWIFIGYPGQCASSCIPSLNANSSPNGSPEIDAAITIFSHEIQDILTDPQNNAWITQDTTTSPATEIELGDLCSGSGVTQQQWFGATKQVAGSNATYNIELAGNQYLVQTIWDKTANQCSLGQ